MWKFLYESVEGTSHRGTDIGCQDSSFATRYNALDEEILIAVCADGAGSASHSQIGSKLACEVATRLVTEFFENGRPLSEVTTDLAKEWVITIHQALEVESTKVGVSKRELACTFLLAVIGSKFAIFCQIGDGAIVTVQGENYTTIFWPQSGEYQNTTFFLTDSEFLDHIQIQRVEDSIEEIAMFTDGLQMLALSYATRSVHGPFFGQMFKALRAIESSEELIVPMRQFLDSNRVNERTDDDKTLILATRVNSANAVI